ncbi:MAG TPA: hypothetical protein PLB50_02670 [Candidatus Saccharicenans sp.]|nr:hypothetical protein [Candidatus Saccharicenans sp.]HQO75566.1 hypothetical protein [Candidatus Saccharicenans sp.]HUM79195.1 hypothetical protein [Candidatus Saccharicenans sp.]
MKNQRVVISYCLLLILTAWLLPGCGPQARKPVAGSARGQDMLTLLPADISAFFVLDWQKLVNLKPIQTWLEQLKELETYQKKAEALPVDFKKDIYYLAVAVVGEMDKPAEGLVALANLKYQKDKLIPPGGGDQKPELKTYNGLSYLPMIEVEEKAIVCLAFLDSSNLAIGSEAAVKKVIDVYQGKTPHFLSNKNSRNLVKDLNTRAITFGWLTVPGDLLQSKLSQNPSLMPLSKVKYISSFSDYKNSTYLNEIKLYAEEKDNLKSIADILTGFKSLGLGLGAQPPELKEVLEAIEITTTEKYLKVFISLKEEQLQAITKLIKEKEKDQKNSKPQTAGKNQT